MIKNIEIENIENSNLYKELKNIFIDKFSFNYLNTDFIIDTKFFFPISIKSYETSTGLFSNYSRFKYEIFFSKKYYNFIRENTNQMISFNKAFVVGSSNNYYHLLIDWLPRLFALNKHIIKKIDKVIFSSEYLQSNNLVQFILNELKIDKEIIFLEKGSYLFKNSFIPVNLSLEEKIFFYRRTFSNYMKFQKEEKIYIVRKDSKNRKIINENQLIQFLEKQNFKIVELSKYNFKDQISLFSNAKIIISMHGAGLANLIFCKKNTPVIEIAHDINDNNEDWYCGSDKFKFANLARDHFAQIAKIIKLNHFLYFCVDNIINKNNDNDKLNLKKLTNTDLSIDVAKFSKFYTNNFRNI